jgi:hypothetical protein
MTRRKTDGRKRGRERERESERTTRRGEEREMMTLLEGFGFGCCCCWTFILQCEHHKAAICSSVFFPQRNRNFAYEKVWATGGVDVGGRSKMANEKNNF